MGRMVPNHSTMSSAWRREVRGWKNSPKSGGRRLKRMVCLGNSLMGISMSQTPRVHLLDFPRLHTTSVVFPGLHSVSMIGKTLLLHPLRRKMTIRVVQQQLSSTVNGKSLLSSSWPTPAGQSLNYSEILKRSLMRSRKSRRIKGTRWAATTSRFQPTSEKEWKRRKCYRVDKIC